MSVDPTREDYGIDAPTVVRNLLVVGVLLAAVGAITHVLLRLQVVESTPVTQALRVNVLISGIICLVMSGWMVASSKWLKHRVADALLDAHNWRGDERVLDVGCGRGLVAVRAARRAPRGRVTGIDLWQQRDLGDNKPDAIRANAVSAGVADRLAIDTGDARQLPYADGTFDVVTSMTVIHNIPAAKGREAAIAECWRVLKPGGQMLIFDIRHARRYAAQLRTAGAAELKMVGPIVLWGPMGWRFSATKLA